jgi:SulP family sulfate permease
VIFSGLRPQPLEILTQMGIRPDGEHLQFADDFQDALTLALAPPGSIDVLP